MPLSHRCVHSGHASLPPVCTYPGYLYAPHDTYPGYLYAPHDTYPGTPVTPVLYPGTPVTPELYPGVIASLPTVIPGCYSLSPYCYSRVVRVIPGLLPGL